MGTEIDGLAVPGPSTQVRRAVDRIGRPSSEAVDGTAAVTRLGNQES